MKDTRKVPVLTSRYRFFITAMPDTDTWSYADGTRMIMTNKKQKQRRDIINYWAIGTVTDGQ